MKFVDLLEMAKSDVTWITRDLEAMRKKRAQALESGGDVEFIDRLIARLEKALEAARLAKESVNEGKTRKDKKSKMPKAPRAKHLHDVMAGRKAGGHFTEKTDFKRAREKAKFQKQMREDD